MAVGLRRRVGGGQILVAFLVVVCGLALSVRANHGAVGAPATPTPMPALPAPLPAAATPSVPASLVTALHSRLVSQSTVQVWGSAKTPDGTTITLVAQTATGKRVVRAPIVSGRFYAAITLPTVMQGQRVMIRARLSR